LAGSLATNNGVFFNNFGLLDAKGAATMRIVIPNHPVLRNQSIFGALVILDPRAPLGVRRISKECKFESYLLILCTSRDLGLKAS
jgi:hypothetical protein